MDVGQQQRVALIALMQLRPRGVSWTELATRAALGADLVELWEELTGAGALLPDPNYTSGLDTAAACLERWTQQGLQTTTIRDEEYPRRLLEIHESPALVFTRGRLIHDDRGMSVVGSRAASRRGLEIAEAAASVLVDHGLSVIAGLALGIDTVAHETALALGGRTVAVIGTGLLRHYPLSNAQLQEQIAHEGLLLSQFWPDAAPSKASFPIRNATMSGYGMATIVVEAGEHSGTRIQARKAVDHGRPVIITDAVATSTTWGRQLRDKAGVYVVGGVEDLVDAVREVIDRPRALERALAAATSALRR